MGNLPLSHYNTHLTKRECYFAVGFCDRIERYDPYFKNRNPQIRQ
jgi:hypothetical protein